MKSLMTAIAVCLASTGCVQNTGVTVKTSSLSQNCLLPNAAAVKSISRRLASAEIVVGPSLCANATDYVCNRKRFSPTATNGKSIVEECVNVPELGGEVCLKLNSQSYSTAEAANRSDVATDSVLPGGELNRSDYLCHHASMSDGDSYLAVGEGDHLNEALAAAFAQCSALVPRIAAGK